WRLAAQSLRRLGSGGVQCFGAGSGESAVIHSTHLLHIEDDSRVRSMVEQGLQARGFQVSSAPDGESGLELAHTLAVGLVLLDLILPGIGGIEVLEEIRTFKPDLPVIVLSALDDTTSMVR